MVERTAGFEELEHTADWALRVWAPNLAGLLEQAARGMYDLSGTVVKSGGKETRSFTVESNDAEGLLVSFLNELLHYVDEEGSMFDEFDLAVAENVVKARVAGTKIIERKKEIKAVTFHNLRIEEKDGLLEAQLVFDV
ncbi:MAG: archease [Anaerolineales bacterium]